MRVLKFGDRDIELEFRPVDVRKFEKLMHKKLIYAIQEAPSIEEIAAFMVAGSGGEIKSIDEAFDLFEKYETGAYGIAKEINEELLGTGWLGLVKDQEQDEEGKN